MCGISGIVNKYNNQLIGPLLLKTNNLLAHRGPDDEGYVFGDPNNTTICFSGNETPAQVSEYNTLYSPKRTIYEALNKTFHLGLAHRRLNIIDLTPNGHQPMCLTDDLWIVYNGEIYNYIEIRKALIEKGYSFKTASDTEVLLIAYKEWGIKMLDKLNGMWAFVIWDKQTNTLFGSRDRFGVKPMYYISDNSTFAFASEIKALTHLTHSDVNKEAAWDYLISGKNETLRESMYTNIYELKPAEYFIYELKSNAFSTHNYYQLAFNTSWDTFSPEDIKKGTDEIQQLLYNAIRIRMRSDVPMGASLSGGLDSSTIVSYCLSIMKENQYSQPNDLLHLFTAHFPDAPNDEYQWAKTLAKNQYTQWHTIQPNANELLVDFDDMIRTQDLPFFSMSVYSHYKVMQTFQKEGIKINFDGQGSDELFGGYQKHYNCYMWEALKYRDVNTFFKNSLPPYFNSFNNPSKFIKELSKKFIHTIPLFHNLLLPNETKYFQNEFINTYKEKYSLVKKDDELQPLNQFLHHQFCGPDLKVLLRMGDRNAMRFGVETRTPFVDDHLLVEKIFSLSSSIKIHNGISKHLLRTASDKILPETIRQRRDKIGYATPEINWLKTIHHELYNLIPDQDDELIQYSKLKKDWFHIIQDISDPGRIWRIINFMRWKKLADL